MKTTVIFHNADFDGIFCREIARKFLPDAELIGWDFSDKPLPIPDGPLYVLDLPLDAPFGFKYKPGDSKGPQHPAGLVWIDHHKSAIESHPKDIPGYRIDGVAACRLAWQWFTMVDGNTKDGYIGHGCPAIRPAGVLPMVQDYKNREVNEPIAVRLAGEYDIWDKRDPDAETFQFGLRSRDLDGWWPALLSDEATATVAEIENRLEERSKFELMPNGNIKVPGLGERVVKMLLKNGAMIQAYQQINDAGMMFRSFIVEWEGLKFLALTTARCNSLTFASKDVPETGHDALMGFYFNGTKWTVSLYHAKHNTGIDLSQIAVKYGGGGHRGACGFTVEHLPFLI